MKKKHGRWTGELQSYALVALLLVVGVLLLLNSKDLGPKEIGPALLSFVGTFLGAFLAFRLQQWKESKADESAKAEALNRALIVLALQYNDMLSTKAHLDKYEGKINRMINLPAHRSADQFDQRQNVESLAFLIDHNEAQLIMSLAIEQGRFDAARDALMERCRIHVNIIQPLMEKHQLNNKSISEDELRNAFGEMTFGALETATEQVFFHVSTTADSLKTTMNDLHAAAKKIFPKHIFIKVI